MKTNDKIKVSRYTFTIKDRNQFYLYNTLSNALIEVDEALFNFINHRKGLNDDIGHRLDDKMLSSLMESKFITENDEDDFLTYKSNILSLRNEKHCAILTIAPTMDCCFNCHYCFEKSKRPSYMSEDVMTRIVKFIANIENLKLLKITWFGGEPLMAVPEMEKLYRKLRHKFKDVPFFSNIITSGYYLNEQNIKSLQKMKVSHIQITLDGLKETHNKIKFTEGCDDAFSTVLDNIERTCELAPEIRIVVRTNLTKSNAHEYQELQQTILSRFAGKNVHIAPAFVISRSDCSNIHDSNLFSAKEYPEYILGLAERGIDSPQIRYPDKIFTECAIRNPYSLSFDPEGNVYKCWEHIGEFKYAIGKISKNGKIEKVNSILLNRHLYGADPIDDRVCRKCPYLPICGGGCPIQRVENAFNNGKNICCTYYKGHIDEFILEHIRRKEAMENR